MGELAGAIGQRRNAFGRGADNFNTADGNSSDDEDWEEVAQPSEPTVVRSKPEVNSATLNQIREKSQAQTAPAKQSEEEIYRRLPTRFKENLVLLRSAVNQEISGFMEAKNKKRGVRRFKFSIPKAIRDLNEELRKNGLQPFNPPPDVVDFLDDDS